MVRWPCTHARTHARTNACNACTHPPQAVTHPPNTSDSGIRYSFDNPLNQWRSLRVANATHNMSYVEWDKDFVFDHIDFAALFDLNADPYQVCSSACLCACVRVCVRARVCVCWVGGCA